MSKKQGSTPSSDVAKVRNSRLCVACRNKKLQNELIRLTVDFKTKTVFINNRLQKVHGRSAYLCISKSCTELAFKGTRLKYALEGRAVKGVPHKRMIRWPLEPQLITVISGMCTEGEKTCQNTERKETLE